MPDMDYLVVSVLVHWLNDFPFIVEWQSISFITPFILTADVLVLPHSIDLVHYRQYIKRCATYKLNDWVSYCLTTAYFHLIHIYNPHVQFDKLAMVPKT